MAPSADVSDKLLAVYWGIADVKYDPRLPEGERVRVLELGDGQTSGFSQDGSLIRETFERQYSMDPRPLRCAVLVENKKLTHDRFLAEGFKHLRPPARCYPREYHAGLATKILADLGLAGTASAGGAVVLKLLNRSRGAGVLVVPAAGLDRVVERLLVPPAGEGLERLFDKGPKEVLNQTFAEILEESCLHWWSNDCPFFIAERFCQSVPVRPAGKFGRTYDGTMRVSFVLRRLTSEDSSDESASTTPERLTVDWLGGYWKLPRTAVPPSTKTNNISAETSLEKLMARTLSSFSSADKLTAEVLVHHLEGVCRALTPALPSVFRREALHREQLLHTYCKQEPLFCAFILTRLSASVRLSRMERAVELMSIAQTLLPNNPSNRAARAASSYLERNIAVCCCIQKDWDGAAKAVAKATKSLPTSSTAYYLRGLILMESEKIEEAAFWLQRSILLDPDFKLPYLALGNCYLLLEESEMAAEASRACLRRYPDSPAARLNKGQALYQMLYNNAVPSAEKQEQLCQEAIAALALSKERVPGGWQGTHECMLQYLQARLQKQTPLETELIPISTWKVEGWRP